ncbi:MAG: hypothetical protein ACK5HS_01740 [Mycoplasmatales bacterium]
MSTYNIYSILLYLSLAILYVFIFNFIKIKESSKNNGEYGRVIQYLIPQYYPIPDDYTNDKYKEIIVNQTSNFELDEEIQSKLKILDKMDLFKKHKDTMKEILDLIYDNVSIKSGKDIVLTQPLHSSSYCCKQDQKNRFIQK